jgi:histidine triad (HIT) family protein
MLPYIRGRFVYHETASEEMRMATIFSKIIAREIPTDIVYEDELCLAFKDINPQAPVHVLVIPKKEIARLVDAVPEDQALLGHLMLAAGKIARQLGVGDAFRVVVNNGAEVGQSVFHVHLHILAGRRFRWPPG